MRWRKLGHVYAPSGDRWWARSYATVPTAEIVDDQVIRVYFASLDENRFGRIGYIEVDVKNPQKILYETPEPILDVGAPGTFDDCGVNPSCIVLNQNRRMLYYIGWQRTERVPYMLFAGCAISDGAEANFSRTQSTPVLDRTVQEPFLRSATTIIVQKDKWRIWYVSASNWIKIGMVPYPKYSIYSTFSLDDGVTWNSDTHEAIPLHSTDEFGLGRPWVLEERSAYKMWYSIRSTNQPYRMGYAESMDGMNWERKDDRVGIVRSESGWDSEMICYPCIVDVAGRRYMFYNGNRHGATGFGCAILEQD